MHRARSCCALVLCISIAAPPVSTAAPPVSSAQAQEAQEQEAQEQEPPIFESEARPAGEPIEITGYSDFRQGGIFIADGQRVRIFVDTVVAGEVSNPADIGLGFEFRASGIRLSNGVILAYQVDAEPNSFEMMESQVVAVGNQLEREWLQAGYMYEGDRIIGEIVSWDDRVRRVERIMADIVPEWVAPGAVRVHVVETDIWNASAMANGALWVYTGLIEAMNDDELAIILGHELAHFTYEHSRQGAKKGMLATTLIGLGAGLLAGLVGGGAARQAVDVAAVLGTAAFSNGYSRELEDQADRVGLRYAFEGGYDPYAGPGLWARFREKYGEVGQITNFFLSSHSRPSQRIEAIEEQIRINYRDPEAQLR